MLRNWVAVALSISAVTEKRTGQGAAHSSLSLTTNGGNCSAHWKLGTCSQRDHRNKSGYLNYLINGQIEQGFSRVRQKDIIFMLFLLLDRTDFGGKITLFHGQK